MATTFPLSTEIDGAKFAARYSLNALTDFWVDIVSAQLTLFIKDGITLPDNPPIIDPPDSLDVGQRKVALDKIDNDREALLKLLRGEAGVIIDELNNIREWIVSFKASVAASTSLANLQTRVAALPDMPDRTLAQAITAIKNKINAGTVD